jgi:hypothetical protein
MPINPEVRKQLDAVVGDSYAPPRHWGASFAKWAIMAVLAVAAAIVVVSILHTHVVKAQKAAAAKRPVPVQIIPAK